MAPPPGGALMGGALLLVISLLHAVSAAPEPPYVTFDVWWKGIGASSCQYYNGAFSSSSDDFFLNCSLTAYKPNEANLRALQPHSYSTLSPSMVYTKCSRDSPDCSRKHICHSYGRYAPNNATVGGYCSPELHIGYLNFNWDAGSERSVYRSADPGAKEQTICDYHSPDQPNGPTTCTRAMADEVDAENVVGYQTSFWYGDMVAFTALTKGGLHQVCYFNASDHIPMVPHKCDHTKSFTRADRPRLLRTDQRGLANQVVVLTEAEICTLSFPTQVWACAKVTNDQKPVWSPRLLRGVLSWVVPSASPAGTARTCNTTLPLGGAPIACLPLPGVPAGRTTTTQKRHWSPGQVAVGVETPSGGVVCYNSGGGFAPYECTRPMPGKEVASIGLSIGLIFQVVDRKTGAVSICRADGNLSNSVVCMDITAPLDKIGGFSDWFS